MGRYLVGASAVAGVVIIFGLAAIADQRSDAAKDDRVDFETALAVSDIGSPVQLSVGSNGSALATAAFGLSALQPETYNGEIVIDIIDASPLQSIEKQRLVSSLHAAEAGQADLQQVLADVRVTLAVE